jgi:hypothetical protein
MPVSKDGHYDMNPQRARAREGMPRPKPLKKEPETRGGGRDADHGGIAKVETIVHHHDGHQEHQEHGSAAEAADHLQSLPQDDANGMAGDADEGAEVECPECHGQDPHCPMCDGTGKIPASEEEQGEQETY